MAQNVNGRDPAIDQLFLAALNVAAKKNGFEILAANPVAGQNQTSETTLFKKAIDGGRPERIPNGSYSTYPGQQRYLVAYAGDGWPASLEWEWLGNQPFLTLEISAGRFMNLTSSGSTDEELGNTDAMVRLVEFFLAPPNRW